MDLFEPVTGLAVCLTWRVDRAGFKPAPTTLRFGLMLAGGIRRLATAGDSQPVISNFCRACAGYSSRSSHFRI